MNLETTIMLMGGIYALIEAVQLIMLISQTKRTADTLDLLINDKEVAGAILKNGFVGMSEAIRKDPDSQQAFGELISWMGQIVLTQAQQTMVKGQKMPKVKSLGDVFSMLWQMPAVQGAVEKKVDEISGGAVDKVVSSANW